MEKSHTLKINRKIIYFLIIGLTVGFVLTLLLQQTKTFSCASIVGQNDRLKQNEIEELKNKYVEFENYLNTLKEKKPKTKDDLILEINEFNYYFSHYAGAKMALEASNPYAEIQSFSSNPCETQSYPQDFNTYFGNIVHGDINKYTSFKYVNEDESKLLKGSGKIVIAENKYKIEDYGRYPPKVKYFAKYKVFDNTFSLCDCGSKSQKGKVYIKAMFADFIPATIIGLIIAVILSLVWKFNFKIKITK
ncbi:MAG: hypothetical protein Q7W45_12355 [Bacteroidota bacterium]|nr:hypothetical protein [Bacteroidota bacterium]MDP3146880.1 hypothetical protein [Bacteroidota bacterium]